MDGGADVCRKHRVFSECLHGPVSLRSILPNGPACPPDHTEAAGDRNGHAADEKGSHAGQLRQSDGFLPGLDSSRIPHENPFGKCRLDSCALINSQKVGVKR